MKKIIFMLVFSLTALTATDKAKFTISNSGILDAGTSKTQSDTLLTSSAEVQTLSNGSTIIPNSIHLIWESMHGENTGWVSNMPSNFGQFQGPGIQPEPGYGAYNKRNIWFEVEAAGDGSSCSNDINKAKNTRVEIGYVRMAVLRNGKWTKPIKDYKIAIGARYPVSSRTFTPNRGCSGVSFDHPSYVMNRTEPSGFNSVLPKYNYRWHAWNPGAYVTPISGIQAIFGEVYFRLIVDDPSKPDDRHLANFVAHLGSDKRMDNKYISGSSISRYIKITNDWTPLSLLTGNISKAELEANPPPFSKVP